MIKILECCPCPSDGTSYYRSRGPLAALENSYPDQVQIFYLPNYLHASWADLIPYDIIFVQRPSSHVEFEFLQKCRQLNKKIWLDYDDLLTDVPESNPVFHVNHFRTKNTIDALSLATVVSVTTQEIASAFRPYCKNIQVIKNAHDDFIFPLKHRSKLRKEKKTVVWRGSITHEADIYEYREMIRQINEKYDLHVFGYMAEYMRRDLGIAKERIYGQNDVITYLNNFYSTRPDVMVFPLEQHPFNVAKSNIAAIETLYAGGICFTSEGLPEFSGSALHFNKDNGMELIESVINDQSLFEQIHIRHWSKIEKEQLLSVTNKLRLELIKNL